jgi:hypothetical protein
MLISSVTYTVRQHQSFHHQKAFILLNPRSANRVEVESPFGFSPLMMLTWEDSNLTEVWDFSNLGDTTIEPFDFDAFLNSESPSTFPELYVEQSVLDEPAPTPKKQATNGSSKQRTKRERTKQIHVCKVHPAVESVQCFGIWSYSGRYRGARCTQNVTTFIKGQLPVCSQHRGQIKKMVHCEAILEECGLACGAVVSWKPHSFPLCEAHRSQGKRCFEELPVEIRLIIYEYLIPNIQVPAVRPWIASLRKNGEMISTALFRVNRTIYEEFADMFYGQPTYAIEITKEWESKPTCKMCCQRPSATTTSDSFQYGLSPWNPPISLLNFQRIRSIQLNITLGQRSYPNGYTNKPTAVLSIIAETWRNLLCDDVHRFTERMILSNQLPLRKLGIKIRVEDMFAGAASFGKEHCKGLLKPIQRLLTRPAVFEYTRSNDGSEMILLSKNTKMKDGFVHVQPLPSLKSPTWLRFDQLARLLSQMRQHPFWRESDIEQIETLLSHGRAAREADDIKAIASVFGDFVKMLRKYSADQHQFMLRMRTSLETMRPVTQNCLENA